MTASRPCLDCAEGPPGERSQGRVGADRDEFSKRAVRSLDLFVDLQPEQAIHLIGWMHLVYGGHVLQLSCL